MQYFDALIRYSVLAANLGWRLSFMLIFSDKKWSGWSSLSGYGKNSL